MRGRIEEQTEVNRKTAEEQEADLVALEEELIVRTQDADEADEKLKQCQKIIQSLLEGIHSVFKFIQCDPTPALQLLGQHSRPGLTVAFCFLFRFYFLSSCPGYNSVVTSYNCMLYLDLLEKRVTDINDLVWYLSFSKVAVRAARLFPGQVSYLREPVMKEPVSSTPKILPADKVVPTQPCPLYVNL